MTNHADIIEAAAKATLNKWHAQDHTLGTYLHGSHVQASLKANLHPAPWVVLFDYTVNQKSTTDRVERADCTMYFADAKPGQGDSPELEAAAVARMNLLKRLFFAKLDASPTLEISNMRATPFHNAYAAELTGVGVQFSLGVPVGAFAEACL